MESVENAAPQQLSSSQEEALRQFMAVTNQNETDSIPILRRSHWSVPVAIAKFFDGEDAELEPSLNNGRPLSGAAPINEDYLPAIRMNDDPFAPLPPSLGMRMATALADESNRRIQHAERSEPARRIVPPPPASIWRPPRVLFFLIFPFYLCHRILTGFWRGFAYVGYLASQRLGLRMVGVNSSQRRRQLSPRDSAARFKREFEEAFGSNSLPLVEDSYAHVYDKAKQDLKYLLIILLSLEHDDTHRWVRDTLLSPEVLDLLNDPSNNILVWGGNMRDAEAYQVAQDFQCTKLPFSALICVTPKEGGNTRMGTIRRLAGPTPPQLYSAALRSAKLKYDDDLAAVRAVRRQNEASRAIRAQQDDAYERSLARDRERARERLEAEAAAAEAERQARKKEAEAARRRQMENQWRLWRYSQMEPEPTAGRESLVRVAIKLPESRGGRRVRRSFASTSTVEDLYAFVDCCDIGADVIENISEKIEKPKDYKHEYGFRIASVMPRVIHEPSETKTLVDALGPSASLVVEDLDYDSDDCEAGQ